jgi:hypothetical protein
MLDLPYFRLGPIGQLNPLVIPEPGIQVENEFIGNVHTSLIGKKTADAHGWRRKWNLTQAYLDSDDYGLLRAYYMRLFNRPLRFLDPLEKNRALPGPSGGGRNPGWSKALKAFHLENSTHGIVTDRILSMGHTQSYVSDGDQRDVEFTIDNGMRWNVGAATASQPRLFLNGPVPDITTTPVFAYVDPIIPGETVTYSVYVQCDDGANVSLRIYGINSISGSMGSQVGSTATTTNTAWTRLSVTFTISDLDTYVGITPVLTNSNRTGYVNISKAQLEAGDTATSWVHGLGVPEVTIMAMSAASPRYPLVTTDLEIQEL